MVDLRLRMPVPFRAFYAPWEAGRAALSCILPAFLGPPNTPIQPTPLGGPKIGAILKAGIGPTAFPIYGGGAADGQAVGRAVESGVLVAIRWWPSL
jgi:hypothetical protein